MKVEELKYIIQSAHVNFLYGSGVSRPYLVTLGNIEEYLTKLEKDESLSDDVYYVVRASLYKAYCDGVISPNYIFPRSDTNFLTTQTAYSDFFHIWNDIINKRSSLLLEKQVNLFTTNIDLLVEDTLSNSGLELNDGFRGTLNPTFNETNFQISLSKSSMQYHKAAEIPVFNLMKIHGSVNWEAKDNIIFSNKYRCGRIEELLSKIPANYFVSLTKNDSNGKKVDKTFHELVDDAGKIKLTSTDIFNDFFKEYDQIVMINPTKEKFKTSVMDYHFYELMRIYSNALERENSVLFVMGFSFADEHLAQLTKRAAATNPTLQVIVFAFSDNDKDKYLRNLGITGKGTNNNIAIITPTDFKRENNSKDKKYEDLCKKIDHFDLPTINLVFDTIAASIHSSI